MRLLYQLAYPDPSTRNEVYLTEKFINALNNREVQNYVRRRKPPTYTKALHIANEETSFILMDLATHAPGGFQAPTQGTIVSLRPSRLDALSQEGAPPLAANVTTVTKRGTSRRGALPGLKTS